LKQFNRNIKGLVFLFTGICLLFLPYDFLHAQKKAIFNGVVNDASDGSPLVAASVKVDKDFSTGTISGIDGRFSIELDPGLYTFEISFLGMKTETITLTLEPGVTIERVFQLEPLWRELEGAEVKVSKFEKPIEEITFSLQVLKPILIESKNIRNITTVLDMTPGLNIMDNEPQIRGGSGFTFGVGSKVAVLIDDMPMISGEGGRPYWDLIPVKY